MSHIDILKGENIYHQAESGVSVFKGIKNPGHIPVAIKEQVFASINEANASIREALSLMQLSHPHICQGYDCFLEQLPYGTGVVSVLIQELMDYDLYEEIKRRATTSDFWLESELLTHLGNVVSALKYAESMGISHRDIKPQNLFLKDGLLKLGDFGSAGRNLDFNKMTSTLQGSPFFLSPELKRLCVQMLLTGVNHADYDPFKSDVYSLGVTVLFMARLKPPGELMDLNSLEVKTAQVIAELEMYPNVQKLLVSMLEIDPKNRIGFRDLDRIITELYESWRNEGENKVFTEPVFPGLKNCLNCNSPVQNIEWTGQIPIDSCRYCEYLSDLCSLDCLLQFQQKVEQANLEYNCLWCFDSHENDPVVLECEHKFDDKQCFISYLRSMTVDFTEGFNFKCLLCQYPISEEFISTVFPKPKFEKLVLECSRTRCQFCSKNRAEQTCRSDHYVCKECTIPYMHFFTACPICNCIILL